MGKNIFANNDSPLDSHDHNDPYSVTYKGDLIDDSSILQAGGKKKKDPPPKPKSVYYNSFGEFLGYDNKNEDKVYITSKFNYEYMLGISDGSGEANYDELRKISTELSIKHSDFISKCSAVYGESSVGYGIFVKEELYAIASVHIINAVAYGVGNAGAKKFRGTSIQNRNKSIEMKTAIAAFISALQNGIDYSNGADQWDGAEQAMIPIENMDKASNGRFMYKMNVMGWSIEDEHYNSWKEAVENKFGVGRFTVPQEKEAVVNYGGMKNKGKIRLYSKAQYGLSIFWQTI